MFPSWPHCIPESDTHWMRRLARAMSAPIIMWARWRKRLNSRSRLDTRSRWFSTRRRAGGPRGIRWHKTAFPITFRYRNTPGILKWWMEPPGCCPVLLLSCQVWPLDIIFQEYRMSQIAPEGKYIDANGEVAADETVNLIASDKVEGTAVYDRAGNHLGSVYNAMINKVTGQVAYVVISFGGFLGIGADYNALPCKALVYDRAMG